MSLNPLYPNWYRNSLSRVLMVLGEFDEALLVIEKSLGIEPANLASWISKAYNFGSD